MDELFLLEGQSSDELPERSVLRQAGTEGCISVPSKGVGVMADKLQTGSTEESRKTSFCKAYQMSVTMSPCW